LTVDKRIVTAGRRNVLAARVRDTKGRGIARATVLLRYAGVVIVRRTNRAGIARFAFRPTRAGILTVTVRQPGEGARKVPAACTKRAGIVRALPALTG
jgi:hypothetical protein